MVEVNGKMYGTILVDVNEAISALCDEAKVLRTIKVLDDKKQANVELFLDALEIIRANYCEVYNSRQKDSPLEFIEVNGFLTGSAFYVEGTDIINSLYKKFCIGYRDLMVRKQNDSEMGVFNCYDTAYHGSPDYEYNLVYEGKTACEVFKAIRYLDRNYREYNNWIEEETQLKQQAKGKSRVLIPNSK